MPHPTRALKNSAFAICISAAVLTGCAVEPSPLSEQEMSVAAIDRASRVTTDQETITNAIDLYEAIARAIKYNLDTEVEKAEIALRYSELNLAHFNLLPQAVANSGFTARDKFNASSSYNVLTNTQNFGASTSQEKRFSTSDLTFSWHVLDFGLSYVRARQAADKALIAQELRRKVVHRVVEDVRSAYWRAVSSERLIGRLKSLEHRVATTLRDTRTISADKQASPITAITYERELVEIKRTIQELQRELIVAKSQLAALMNVKPGTHFSLVLPLRRTVNLALKVPLQGMIDLALEERPELREVTLKQRINTQEAHAALLELLPGLQLYAGTNFDSNDFLYQSNWLSWGAKASWNVMKVFQYPRRREVVEDQDALLDKRALALTMAVMTQVHVSRARFYHLKKELVTAGEYHNVQKRLVEQMRAESKADRISQQTLIREEMNMLVADAKLDVAYASLQSAFANTYAAIGLDPYRDDLDTNQSVRALSQSLRGVWFERGDYSAKLKQTAALR